MRLRLDLTRAFDLGLATSFAILAAAVFVAAGWPRLGALPRSATGAAHRVASGPGWRSEYLLGLAGGLAAVAIIVGGSLLVTTVVLIRRRRT